MYIFIINKNKDNAVLNVQGESWIPLRGAKTTPAPKNIFPPGSQCFLLKGNSQPNVFWGSFEFVDADLVQVLIDGGKAVGEFTTAFGEVSNAFNTTVEIVGDIAFVIMGPGYMQS
jgi:hypothetical protein